MGPQRAFRLVSAVMAIAVASSLLVAVPGSAQPQFQSKDPSSVAGASGKRVEVQAARSANRQVFAEPDGTFTMELSPGGSVGVQGDYSPPGAGWTKVFSGKPNNAYWNGGGDDALVKVGYCGWDGCNGIGVSRGYVQFDISALRGAQILGAEFNMHEVYSPSCTATQFDVYSTGPIGSGTTWNSQPGGWWGPIGSPNVAYGYNSTCPMNWVGVDAGAAVNNKLNEGSNVATFLMKAANEGDKFAWKKFDTARLIVHYNWVPSAGNLWANVGQGPSLGCPTVKDQAFAFSGRPTLRAVMSDPDGQNVAAQFEWWNWGGTGPVGSATTASQPNGTGHAVTIPNGAFGHDARISWRVRAYDGIAWSGWSVFCQLTVDQLAPGRPGVISTDYPENGTGGYVGKTGAFTVTATDSDVLGFQWSLNFQDMPAVDINSPHFVRATNGAATIRATPTRDGPNDLYVRAVDRALNVSLVYQKSNGSGGWVPGGFHFLVGSAVPRPEGYWPMNGDNVTTVPDVSGHGRHGTVTRQNIWTVGRTGDALSFNGTSDYVTTTGPAVNTAGTYTVAAWARLDKLGGYPAIVSQDGNRMPGFQLQAMPEGRWAFAMFSGDVDGGGARHDRIFSSTPVTLGAWTHLVGMYDSGAHQMRLYVNGSLAASADHPVAWNATGPLTIGRSKWNGAPADYFPGSIDDVRAYSRLLSDSEIQDLANQPAVEQAFYPLDEGAGDSAGDVSGNYRTGTVSGATWTAGPVGTGALEFDGVDDAVTTAQQAIRTDRSFTVSARAYLDTNGGVARAVVSQDGPTTSGFSLQYNGTSKKWQFAVSPLSVESAAPAVPGEWVNLTGVYDMALGQIRLYVNGTEHIAAGRITAPIDGNVVIGRSKAAGTATAFFDGRVDDVHIYTGTRSRVQIDSDNLNPVTARPTPYNGQLSRYVDHTGHHFAGTGPVPPGHRFEGSLGMMALPGTPGTRMLYSCWYNGGQFVALSPACEGKTLLGEIGLLYINPPTDVPSLPIYRCVVVESGDRNGDHFIAHDPDCAGYKMEGLMGYSAAYRHLIRFVKEFPPYDHITSVSGAPQGYRAEGVHGLVAMTQEPGTSKLYACVDGTDEFVSLDAACEGKQVRYWIGNVWTNPPAHAQTSVRLYACTINGERYTSTDEWCEGYTVAGPLGYLIVKR